MANFVFVSPTFPDTYYQFPKAWKELGGTSLCIGEDPYEYLSEDLKRASDEYYQVSSLGDYDQMYRAVAWFAHKHGKIDWLESHNEFWLEQDAMLRTDFNITTGDNSETVRRYKRKSGMKKYYEKAGVKTARWAMAETLDKALEFTAEVGYPIIVKPDTGVGANATYKINNDDELRAFFNDKPAEPYIMEEFVTGEIVSFDGLCGRNGEIIFRTVHVYKSQVMDVLNHNSENFFYSLREVPEDIDKIGRAVIEAFDLKARFFHTEYFRMTKDKKGLGKKGDLIGLEVNMRLPGGYIPDMMNFANNIDLFRMYADMCMNGSSPIITDRPYYCAFFGRRDWGAYVLDEPEIFHRYGQNIRKHGRMPGILEGMGDDYYIACFKTLEEVEKFGTDIGLKYTDTEEKKKK